MGSRCGSPCGLVRRDQTWVGTGSTWRCRRDHAAITGPQPGARPAVPTFSEPSKDREVPPWGPITHTLRPIDRTPRKGTEVSRVCCSAQPLDVFLGNGGITIDEHLLSANPFHKCSCQSPDHSIVTHFSQMRRRLREVKQPATVTQLVKWQS